MVSAPEDAAQPEFIQAALSLADFGLLVHALQVRAERCEGISRFQWQKAERELFIVKFLGNTGLRRDELALARMSDIQLFNDTPTKTIYQLLRVRENGSIVADQVVGEPVAGGRTIVLNAAALSAIARYRHAFKTIAAAAGDTALILLPIRTSARRHGKVWSDPVTGQVVYETVCEAMRHASEFYSQTDPRLAELFRAATPYWLRYTFALVLRQLGTEPELIQAQLGCATMATAMSVFAGHE
jgi:integrase